MKKIFLIFVATVMLSSCATKNLPPVTQERLNEMLAEIVERESRIITEEESDTVIENKKEGQKKYYNTSVASKIYRIILKEKKGIKKSNSV